MSEINKHERKNYSQNGEDGIIAYIFGKIGEKHKTFVEFGMGWGIVCNTAYLSLRRGWSGLLIDCNPKRAKFAEGHYAEKLEKKINRVVVVEATLTVENINEVIGGNGFKGEIDFLSIDVDGNDYWLWKALTVVSPRVLCIEYNHNLLWKKALTHRYDPNIVKWDGTRNYGVSLMALKKLGDSKGYALIGCESNGVNAFFIKRDELDGFKEVSPRKAYYRYHKLRRTYSLKENFDMIDLSKFVEV